MVRSRTLLFLGSLAFLAFLTRAWLDWRFVYGDFIADDDTATNFLALVFYGVVSAAWTWSLIGVGRDRRGGTVGIVVLSSLLLVLGGIGTAVALCPWPCDTAWPLMEVANSGGFAIGLAATIAAIRRIRAGS